VVVRLAQFPGVPEDHPFMVVVVVVVLNTEVRMGLGVRLFMEALVGLLLQVVLLRMERSQEGEVVVVLVARTAVPAGTGNALSRYFIEPWIK
jgi:hypothetical protein